MTDRPSVIDFIAREGQHGVALICVDETVWDGSTAQIVALQEKLQAYAVYALDGALARDHPEFSTARIELRLVHTPDPVTKHFLSAFRDVLHERGLAFSIKQLRRPNVTSTPGHTNASD